MKAARSRGLSAKPYVTASDRVDERAAREPGFHVFKHLAPHGRAGVMRGATLVRMQYHVIQGNQAGRHLRLALEHIQSGRSKRATCEELGERCLVDDRAAGDVDEHACRAECLEDGLGEEYGMWGGVSPKQRYRIKKGRDDDRR